MAANGRGSRRRARIWPALLLIAVLLAACVGAIRWGLSGLFWDEPTGESLLETPSADEPQPETPEETTSAADPEDSAEPEETGEPTEPDEPAAPETSDEPAVEDGVWNLRLVNRWNPLPEDYTLDLVEVPGGQQVDARIYDALMELLDAATEAQLGPIVVAGYRTQEKQQSLYDEKLQSYLDQGYSQEEAVAQTEQWVARPGTSEHQLGLAVDINGAVYAIYPWLQEHSWEYGFIFRYPADKQDLTGVANEEWHYRYVGKETAQAIYEQGVCLEEYLQSAP